MRITFVSPAFNLSGGVKVVAIYAQRLRRMGHNVSIVAHPPFAMPLRHKLKSLLTGQGWPRAAPPHRSHLDGTDVDLHILDRSRPVVDSDVPDGDVVIATWWETAEWVNALSASKGAKVYFIQHHEIFPHLPLERCHATYRLPLHKIVIARWLKDVMAAQYGDNVVDLVPNSVDQGHFFAPVRDKQPVPTVGCLYSSHAFKGLDVTLAALQVVRKRISDLRLIAFGVDPPPAGFEYPEGAELIPSPQQDRIRDLYARCDVWVTASRTEGFNLPAIEAMACRTPVVSTRAGWPQEAIRSGWNGVLVDVDDCQGLAEGVEWVLSRTNEQWKELSANAYATATAGSWEDSARMFEQALERARRRTARGEI